MSDGSQIFFLFFLMWVCSGGGASLWHVPPKSHNPSDYFLYETAAAAVSELLNKTCSPHTLSTTAVILFCVPFNKHSSYAYRTVKVYFNLDCNSGHQEKLSI